MKNIVKNINIYMLILVSLILPFIFTACKPKPPAEDEEPKIEFNWSDYRSYAHAFGGIEGYTYTNSIEAFELNYAKGFRLFEVDLTLSAEGELILIHSEIHENQFFGLSYLGYKNWEHIPYDVFMDIKIFGKFTPLDVHDLAQLLEDYDDIFIITDTKYMNPTLIEKQFKRLAEVIGPKNIDRIIPQCYTLEMYDIVQSIYNFKNCTLTTYNSAITVDQIIEGLKTRPYITAVVKPWSDPRLNTTLINELGKLNIPVWAHTIDDMNLWNNLKEKGVKGICTNELFIE
ncbi:MAG: hypothetical protein FWD32_00275 [Firmicutes bacterium]|nr:hypothetical protein [Bacillota bacterium]